MSQEGFKVKAIAKGYYDAIREPGITNRAGEDLSIFYIRKKSDFSPSWMEAIDWKPDAKLGDEFIREDGTIRTAEEVANIQSDKLDENIRKARANKIAKEEVELAGGVATAKASDKPKRSL